MKFNTTFLYFIKLKDEKVKNSYIQMNKVRDLKTLSCGKEIHLCFNQFMAKRKAWESNLEQN